MRTLQRAALVAAVVAGLSALGAGTSFADGTDGPYEVSAVASAQATAVVTWDAPHSASKPGHKHDHGKPCHKHHQKKPCHKHHGKKPCHKHEKPCRSKHGSRHAHKRWGGAERFSRAWADVSSGVA